MEEMYNIPVEISKINLYSEEYIAKWYKEINRILKCGFPQKRIFYREDSNIDIRVIAYADGLENFLDTNCFNLEATIRIGWGRKDEKTNVFRINNYAEFSDAILKVISISVVKDLIGSGHEGCDHGH